jgi:hypothetical protein
MSKVKKGWPIFKIPMEKESYEFYGHPLKQTNKMKHSFIFIKFYSGSQNFAY